MFNEVPLMLERELIPHLQAKRANSAKKIAYGKGCASFDGGPFCSVVLKITMKN